jgi:lipid A 3-O-deacylase
MRGWLVSSFLVGFYLLFFTASPRAGEIYAPLLAVTEENDLFSFPNHQDRHYTQGSRVVLLGGDNSFTNLVHQLDAHLPALGLSPNQGNIGAVLLGQNIYTPNNLKTNALITTDRPYGGWSYTGLIFQRRGKAAHDVPVLENFEIDVGLTGHESLAEGAQEQVHRWWYDSDIPAGWSHQLKTEPGLILKYERLWRLSFDRDSARYFDFIPHGGADLGNIFTFAEIGGTLRLGYNLPDDFGVQRIAAVRSVHLRRRCRPPGRAQFVPRWQLFQRWPERRKGNFCRRLVCRAGGEFVPPFRAELYAAGTQP